MEAGLKDDTNQCGEPVAAHRVPHLRDTAATVRSIARPPPHCTACAMAARVPRRTHHHARHRARGSEDDDDDAVQAELTAAAVARHALLRLVEDGADGERARRRASRPRRRWPGRPAAQGGGLEAVCRWGTACSPTMTATTSARWAGMLQGRRRCETGGEAPLPGPLPRRRRSAARVRLV